MNFEDAEKTYRNLKEQYAAGKLTDEELEAQVAELSHQDAQGHWWQLGVESGEWYMHDGQKWNKATPPTAPVAPAAPPPAPVVPAAPPPAPVAPAGRGNGKGLSIPILLGIIAVVAVVAILFVVGGYFVISGVLGGNATTTPTSSLALFPSPVIPTLTLVVPTDTPLPPPTMAATATPTAAKPTAARKPASPTPAGPTATKTPNVPPGVYVTDIETIPAQINIGDTIGFKVSFLNTTGSIQTYNWYVKWYQCPEQCQDFKHSQGETLLTNSNLPTGTSTLPTSPNVNLRAGISCNLIAIAYYVDPVNQLPTPFQSTKNDGHFSFTPCH